MMELGLCLSTSRSPQRMWQRQGCFPQECFKSMMAQGSRVQQVTLMTDMLYQVDPFGRPPENSSIHLRRSPFGCHFIYAGPSRNQPKYNSEVRSIFAMERATIL